MFDSPAERTLTYRLAVAHDCWGQRRTVRHGVRNGIWFLNPTGLDEPSAQEAEDPVCERERTLAAFAASRRFTPTELATLRALVIDRLTIDEIAARDGCTRQAVMARLVGNSRGQGGIVKKAQALLSGGGRSDDGVQHGGGSTPTRQSLRRPDGRRGRAA